MSISAEDMAILQAAAPYINASLFNASDLQEIYRREMARSDDVDTGLEKVDLLFYRFYWLKRPDYRAPVKGDCKVSMVVGFRSCLGQYA